MVLTSTNVITDSASWEAWVEFDPLSTEFLGTLYVMGDVLAGGARRVLLCEREGGAGHKELVLELSASSGSRTVTKEVIFSKRLQRPNEICAVCVYCKNELLFTISEIEFLI